MLEFTPVAPLDAGSFVADFALPGLDSKTYATETARENGLVLVTLFKVGCGTCKYAFPYLQRFHEQYAQRSDGRFQVWGVSQDNAEDTRAFAQQNGAATFPILLDSDLSVSAQYGISHVPDLYLLGSEDAIRAAVVGHFSASRFNALAQEIADCLRLPYLPIVTSEDHAPDIKPG